MNALTQQTKVQSGIAISVFFCAISLAAYLSFAADLPKDDPNSSMGSGSPYTNSPPVSVFHVVEGRDPFLPNGYKKPKPNDPAPAAKLDLVISGMSFSENGPLATTKDGAVLEVGSVYTFRSKDGKSSVNYKVLSITDDGVTVLYNDKEETFKLESSDLDKFKEKEESP